MSVGKSSLTIPILAVVLFAASLGWFGMRYWGLGSMVGGPPSGPGAEPTGVARQAPAETEQSARREPDASGAHSAAAPPASASTPAKKQADAPALPAFDVVRIEPSGEGVIAGRGPPGSSVELVVNGKTYAKAVADPSGLFAFVPDALPPGSHEIVLQVRAPDGVRTQSPQSVTVVVAANRTDAPLVTVAAAGQPSVVLSRPDDATRVASAGPDVGPVPGGGERPGGASAPASGPMRISTVETEGGGRLHVSGNATPGATVRLYLNDTFVAPGSAGADGRITFSIERGVLPGNYQVRMDVVDPVSGAVKSRAEVAFAMPPAAVAAAGQQATRPAGSPVRASGPTAVLSDATSSGGATPMADAMIVVPEVNTAIVSRGESLWAISKRAYGEGLRYTVIFGANNRQIRDPNLIYPGQVFVLPTPAEKGAARL